MKTRDVARTLCIPISALEGWSAEYDRFLSPLAHSTGAGTEREFSENDMRVFATVAELRNQGWTSDQVAWVLDHAQAENQVRRNGDLVPRADYEHALDIVQRLEREIERLINERNAALLARDDDLERLNNWIAVLQAELGKARGRLETIEQEWMPMHRVMQIIISVAVTTIVVIILITALLLQRPV